MNTSGLSQLFESGRQFTYEPGDTIIRAGDIPSGVYFIVSGWVKVYSLSKNGEPNIIMTLNPGEIFPIVWAVTGSLHDINYGTLEFTEVRRIPQEQFSQAVQNDNAVTQQVLQTMTRHFVSLTSELDNLQYHSARERIVYRLLSLASLFGQRQKEGVIIPKHVPNEYLARSTNMTRETCSREISRLLRKRFIKYAEGCIVIVNLESLKKELGNSINLSLP